MINPNPTLTNYEMEQVVAASMAGLCTGLGLSTTAGGRDSPIRSEEEFTRLAGRMVVQNHQPYRSGSRHAGIRNGVRESPLPETQEGRI